MLHQAPAEPEPEPEVGPVKKTKVPKKYKNVQALPFYQARRLVARIFEEKVVADAVDDRMSNPRTPFPAFVKDFFSTEYGLKALADKQMYALMKAVEQHSKRADAAMEAVGKLLKAKSSKAAGGGAKANWKKATKKALGDTCDARLWLFGQLMGLVPLALPTKLANAAEESSCVSPPDRHIPAGLPPFTHCGVATLVWRR